MTSATGIPLRSARLGRSILNSQMLISVVLLAFAAVVFGVSPDSLQDPVFFGSLLLVFVLTGVAIMVPWSAATKRWAIALPILDIVAIVGMREAEPLLGAGLFMVFPIIWMARNYAIAGAFAGVTIATTLLIVARVYRGGELTPLDFPGLVLLPITFLFIATTTYATSRRSRSQRILLQQQSALVDSALSRARKQERILDAVLNAVEFGVVAFDRTGAPMLENTAYRKALVEVGLTSTTVVNPTIYQSDRLTPYSETDMPYSRAIAGEEYENVLYWVGSPGDMRSAYSATSRSMLTPGGEIDGGVVVIRNVTTELEAVRARDELAASVTHELRTPLTSILGYVELAADAPELEERTRAMLEVAVRNSERMLALVTDLLRTAGDGDNVLSISPVRCDVGRIAQQAIEAAEVSATKQGITIISDIDRPATTSADPLRVRQVLDNLLTNAVKYNRAGGSIAVTTLIGADAITVSITDTGEGVSPAELEQLFDRYFRTEAVRSSATVGSGLGLAISREIATRHGGSLTASSQVGIGSTFSLVLPIVPGA